MGVFTVPLEENIGPPSNVRPDIQLLTGTLPRVSRSRNDVIPRETPRNPQRGCKIKLTHMRSRSVESYFCIWVKAKDAGLLVRGNFDVLLRPPRDRAPANRRHSPLAIKFRRVKQKVAHAFTRKTSTLRSMLSETLPLHMASPIRYLRLPQKFVIFI